MSGCIRGPALGGGALRSSDAKEHIAASMGVAVVYITTTRTHVVDVIVNVVKSSPR